MYVQNYSNVITVAIIKSTVTIIKVRIGEVYSCRNIAGLGSSVSLVQCGVLHGAQTVV